ncbi:MAG: cation:proton antiporter [Planctomycetes bacterium]|nr:cation:proton antiporter [Planctomycetota bacterium]
MPHLLILGLMLAAGQLAGQVAARVGLPKIVGYLIAGIALSPETMPIVPRSFVTDTTLAMDIALAFITFEIGATLRLAKLRKLGRSILWLTAMEAELAFLVVTAGVVVLASVHGSAFGLADNEHALVFALILGALASATDPAATLAVSRQYRASGPVTDTVLSVAALDDVAGILNFALAMAVGRAFLGDGPISASQFVAPAVEITGCIATGAVGGLALAAAVSFVMRDRDSEGGLIVIVLAVVGGVYGVLQWNEWDALLGTMTMGCVTANTSKRQQDVFALLARYTDELIFVLFFTASGMHLSLSTLADSLGVVSVFVLLRTVGKLVGARIGGRLGHAPPSVRRHAGFALLPQGGVVIGLALTTSREPVLRPMAPALLGIIIGSTVIHELGGPLFARFALRRAGEIPPVN